MPCGKGIVEPVIGQIKRVPKSCAFKSATNPFSLGHVMAGTPQVVEQVATNLRRAGQPNRLHSKALVVIAWRASPAIC